MDYREIMRREFMLRRSVTPYYSLRNFARDLDLTPPHLSCILRGKKGLSADNAYRIALSLGLHNFSARRFYLLVQAQSARSQVMKNLALQGLRRSGVAAAEKTIQRRYGTV